MQGSEGERRREEKGRGVGRERRMDKGRREKGEGNVEREEKKKRREEVRYIITSTLLYMYNYT